MLVSLIIIIFINRDGLDNYNYYMYIIIEVQWNQVCWL